MNINSIRGKNLELQTYLEIHQPNIVAIQETKTDKSVISNELIPAVLGYDIYRNDRIMGGCGTILLVY